MAPVVLTELLSDPKLDASVGRTLAGVPLPEIRSGSGNAQAICEREFSPSAEKLV